MSDLDEGAVWVRDYAPYARWSVESRGEIVRLTQAGLLRLTEDGLHYRITRRALSLQSWAKEPSTYRPWTTTS